MWQPDCILIEGPPEGDAITQWLAHEEMEPPIALLVYRPDEPSRSAMLPFAEFSPEYQALRFALAHQVHISFIDLPVGIRFASEETPYKPPIHVLNQMVKNGGYANYERWWNGFVEQRHDTSDLFTAILEMVTAARQSWESAETAVEQPTDIATKTRDEQREAYMRRQIRAAIANGYERIAVVVGAWHGPALTELDTVGQDDAILTDLSSVAVEAAWIPWTYGRMAASQGYGAGIHSPGWYHHLWQAGQAGATPTEATVRWLTRVAGLLRDEGFDASAAHVIETVRLAESVAALRNLTLPGLTELTEATQTVMCAGHVEPLQLIQRKLVISERMGGVPSGVPLVPLQRDLRNQQKALAMRPLPEHRTLSLDLRDEIDLARSQLLHRLNLLKIPWGKVNRPRGRVNQPQGTYREVWRLRWLPDYEIRVIEGNVWGNTVMEAVLGFVRDSAETAPLKILTELLDQLLHADLPDAIDIVMQRIEALSATSSDVPLLIDALPPLARIVRYGSVRQIDKETIERVVDGLITRICINLPTTIASLDDDASAEMFDKINDMQSVIAMLNRPKQRTQWQTVLSKIADSRSYHQLLVGRAARLLFDQGVDSAEITEQRMTLALTPIADNANALTLEALLQIAFWIEGFLRDSGLVILHDQRLWELLNRWVQQLQEDGFTSVLPLLRRTFASFNELERQQLQEKARGADIATPGSHAGGFDSERANTAMPKVAELLGIDLVLPNG